MMSLMDTIYWNHNSGLIMRNYFMYIFKSQINRNLFYWDDFKIIKDVIIRFTITMYINRNYN